MDLLVLKSLIYAALDIFLGVLLAQYPEVSHFSVEATHQFVRCAVDPNTNHVSSFSNDLTTMIPRKRFRLGHTVCSFYYDGYYSTVVVDTHERIVYHLDSIYTELPARPWDIEMVVAFYNDEAQ